MTRCVSCGQPMRPTLKELPDGTMFEETFCGTCMNEYVWNIDSLDTDDYAFQHLVDPKYKNFRTICDIDENNA